MQKSILKILIILTVFGNISKAQYSFVNYDYTNGLPLDEIKVIAEDSIGYIWLGGPLGLSRFDGNRFTHYYKNSPTDEVAGNIVNDIDVTPKGDVVVVYDDNGISIYDQEKRTFRSKNYTESDSSNFPKHSIVFVHVVNDSSAFIGANREGLYHINLKTLHSKKILSTPTPYDMIENPENVGDYLLTGRGGLKSMTLKDYKIEQLSKHGFSGLKIINDEIWSNDYGSGLNRYNPKTGKEILYPLFFDGVIRGWEIVHGDLWVGTADGLEIIDTSSAEVNSILKSGSSAKDLQGTFIYDVFKDSKNRVWVATDGGLSLYDPSSAYFERTQWLPFQSTHLAPLSNNELLAFDFYTNEIFHINQSRNATRINIKKKLKAPIEIMTTDDEIYVVFYNGIGKYNPGDKTVTEVPTAYSDKKGLIQVLILGDNWFGIYRHQHLFTIWNSSSQSIDTIALGGEPRGMIDTKDGNIWIYGIGILWQYNWIEKTSTSHSLNSEEFANLSGDIVQIDEAEDGYWISTRINGVWKARYENEQFILGKHYTEIDGLTNNNVIHCYTDKNNVLYVQCRSGVFVYNTTTDRFISVGGKNGVNIQTSYGLTMLDSVFHVLGYQSKSFDLRKLNRSPKNPNTIIEEIRVNGKVLFDLSEMPSNFNHKENNIGISFTTLEFTDPSSIRHRYRLDTLSEWVYSEANSSAIQLSALANGEYQFQLATTNGNGLWSESIDWDFIIKPPYWRSWWFVLLMVGLLVLGGYTIYYLRMKQLEKFNSMKVMLAELEGESLRAQMNPHFVFNALNSIKSYIIRNSKEEAADYLTKFSQLIRAVLRNSTQKEISLKDEIEALELYLQIENLRLNKPFEYKIDIEKDIDPASIAFPPLIIQPFVENSIWHGFVHKKTGGNLTINVRKIYNKLSIDIIDDGVGRKKSKEIEKSRERKRSYGIEITETRLQNITDKAEIQIIDLYDDKGVSKGTQVHIELPFRSPMTKNN